MTDAASRARLRALLALSPLMILSACGDDGSSPVRLEAALDQARTRWEAAGLTSYALTQQRQCYCAEPTGWTVVVSDGQPSFIESVEPGGGGVLSERELEQLALDLSMSVEDTFDWIEQRIGNVDAIDATFDPQLGFPTTVSVDPSATVADDEITWILSDVVSTPNCNVVGCLDALEVVLHAPTTGFVAGDYVVVATPSGAAPDTCSFRFEAGVSCGSTVCPQQVTCPLSFPSVSVFIVMLPLAEGPVDVVVEKDGAFLTSVSANAVLERAQPNGPLCPPVCWQTKVDVQLP